MKGVFYMNTEKNQQKWINEIQKNLQLRGRSNTTYNNYKSALKRFLGYYDEKTNITKLKEQDIISFLDYEYLIPNKCKDSYNLAVAAIRLLYLVCFNKSLNRVLLPTAKLTKKVPTIISKKLFITIVNNEKNIKHKCWLMLGFCCGLRVAEISTIKIEDIHANENKLKVLGKGNKERYTILPDIVIKYLREYCRQKRITRKYGYLFEGISNHDCINSNTIINYFTKLKKKYNLNKNISFHTLRHSFSTYYLMNNGSLLALQSMLGHTNIKTTTIYLHMSHNFKELEGIKHV